MNAYMQHLSLFHLYFQDPEIAQVVLDFICTKLFQSELDWWGQQHLWLMQEQGVYQAKDLAELHSE